MQQTNQQRWIKGLFVKFTLKSAASQTVRPGLPQQVQPTKFVHGASSAPHFWVRLKAIQQLATEPEPDDALFAPKSSIPSLE